MTQWEFEGITDRLDKIIDLLTEYFSDMVSPFMIYLLAFSFRSLNELPSQRC